ncbi:MAG: type III pantothenate kinase [Candidatus Omnitrophota bacterium]|nr:MAG: type III pantothenate kinase [Candidatus Omnitrophota bacterium]
MYSKKPTPKESIIVIDIGNTSMHCALVKKGKIFCVWKHPTRNLTKADLEGFLAQYPPADILVCSVVPSLTCLLKALKRKVYIIGKDVNVPISCLYNKKRVGMDRLVGAYAAHQLHASSRLLIDFGTAITFDFLSKNGSYLGGFILPGIGSTLQVFSQCAMLPEIKKINPKRVKKLIPRNTEESIQKGIQEGFSIMINSLVKKYMHLLKIPSQSTQIITGGDAPLIMPYLDFPYTYDPLLALKGLYLLSKKIHKIS